MRSTRVARHFLGREAIPCNCNGTAQLAAAQVRYKTTVVTAVETAVATEVETTVPSHLGLTGFQQLLPRNAASMLAKVALASRTRAAI